MGHFSLPVQCPAAFDMPGVWNSSRQVMGSVSAQVKQRMLLDENTATEPTATFTSATPEAGAQSHLQWPYALLRAKGLGRWAKANLYWERADKLGTSHGIQGFGHLGLILEPEGWKDGYPPITEAMANKVHDESKSITIQKRLVANHWINGTPDSTVRVKKRKICMAKYDATRQMQDLIHQIRVELARDFEKYLMGRPSNSDLDCYVAPQPIPTIGQEVPLQSLKKNGKRGSRLTVDTNIQGPGMSSKNPQGQVQPPRKYTAENDTFR